MKAIAIAVSQPFAFVWRKMSRPCNPAGEPRATRSDQRIRAFSIMMCKVARISCTECCEEVDGRQEDLKNGSADDRVTPGERKGWH